MRITLYAVLGLTMSWVGVIAADKAPISAQAKKGRDRLTEGSESIGDRRTPVVFSMVAMVVSARLRLCEESRSW